MLSVVFFSCNQAVKGEYATVVLDLDGSSSGGRAIGQNGLPYLKDTHITIETDGRLSGTFVTELPPEENRSVVLRFIVGDTVRLRVKASNASGIWSGSTTFTVDEDTNVVSVKLNKAISGAQALSFSMTKIPNGDVLDVYAGNKKIGSIDNVLSPSSFCRDTKGRIFVAYYYQPNDTKIGLTRYDSEGNNPTELIDEVEVPPFFHLILASDLVADKVYLLNGYKTLYEVGETGGYTSWPFVRLSSFSSINCIAAHGGQLFVLGEKASGTELCVYDIGIGSGTPPSIQLNHAEDNDIDEPPSTSTYTDMFVTDDAVYLLRKEYAVPPVSSGNVYSKGALIKYEYDKVTKTISGGTEFGASDNGIQDGIVLTPDTSFYGPLQFIGFDDDVLYIADDGVKFTYLNEAPRITANKNRIAAFNTSTKSLSFADTSVTWRSEERRWKAPDSKIMLWKKAAASGASGFFDYYAVDRADSPLGTLNLPSASSNKYADVFCFDQDGNLYIVKDVGSGSNDYRVQRFKIGEDGGYSFSTTLDTSASLTSLGTSTITAIAGDASGSIEVGGNRHNALYYIVSAPPNADRLGRVSWATDSSLSYANAHGYNPIFLSTGVPAISLEATALAANKDGVFIATKETSGNTYTLKVYKLAHTDTALPGTSLTVGTGTLSVPTITYNEQITALQIQDGVLYGISTKTMQKAAGGATAAFTMSGKLLKLGSTDGSFAGTLTIDTALLYGQKDVDASSDGAFAPYRFIALKPKKLVIASDGGYGQEGTTAPQNKNRVLTFTLDGSGNTGAPASFDVVPAVNFSKEMQYNPPGGCGFVWN